ncbi:MAG TPA: FIVAR domain-containing protein, partial [Candidatus Merdibacter merdavium]|nr:FIVAR domain-containing protein [Candidatus Merdibacter merdavium]
ALRDAVQAAQDAVDDPEADADQLKAANKAMTKAAQELWEIVTKAELEALIESANGYLDGNYTEESLEALQTAITAAQAAANNDDATTAEVTEAITNLANAIAALESITLDTSALAHEIELVTEMVANIDDYVPSTVEGLADKLADAQAAMNAMTQEEIDAATATLREARLNARTKADVSALEELIAYVNSLELSAYTSASAQPVIQNLARAKAMLANAEVTQEEVNDMVETLRASVDDLVEVSVESTTTTDSDTTNTAAAMQTGMFAGLLAVSAGLILMMRRRRTTK